MIPNLRKWNFVQNCAKLCKIVQNRAKIMQNRAAKVKMIQKRASQGFLDPIQKRALSRSVQLEAVYLKALLYTNSYYSDYIQPMGPASGGDNTPPSSIICSSLFLPLFWEGFIIANQQTRTARQPTSSDTMYIGLICRILIVSSWSCSENKSRWLRPWSQNWVDGVERREGTAVRTK